MMLGVYDMAIAVCGLGVWLVVVPIASAVVAAAKIAIAGKRKEIQHLDGGIDKAIYVRDGDHIKEGAILFELDDTRVKIREIRLTTACRSRRPGGSPPLPRRTAGFARHTLTRGAYFPHWPFRAGWSPSGMAPTASRSPPTSSPWGRQSADAAQVVANQQRIFEGRRREMAGQIEVSLERIAQLKEEIGGLTSERVSAAEQSELALKELAVIEKYVRTRLCEPADM